MAAPLSCNLGGHSKCSLKDLAPEKITKYLLRVSTLPERAGTTGNGFLSSLAKMNSIFIMTHFLRQRIHYKYVKKKKKESCEVLLSTIRTGRILNFNVWKSTLGKWMMFWFALLSMTNTMTLAPARQGFTWLTYLCHGPPWREVREEAQTGTKIEITEEYCVVAHSLTHIQVAFLYSPTPPT